MSPHVGNFVQDLVEMAKAVETVPVLQNELNIVRSQLDEALRHNQGLEQNIINYKQSIEDLTDKVRSLEVERDDASFRVLETDEAIQKFLVVIRSAEQSFGEIADGYDPKGSLVEKYYQDRVVREGLSKPQPEPEVLQPQGTPPEPNPATFTGFDPDWKQDQTETSRMPLDQSVVDPTASTISTSSGSVSSVETQDTVPTSDPNPDAEGTKPLGPYFNKRYYDQPNYMPLHEWLAGDGNETNYHWRPSANHGLSY